MKSLLICLIGFFLFCSAGSVWASSPCDDDWELFSNEYCYKIIHKLETFENAAKSCASIGGTMLKIEKPEEQAFLVDYLFNRSRVLDAVWLGGRFTAGKYLWNDHSPLKMSNWASGNPKNLADYCIEMRADLHYTGKWDDEPCGKSNLVVCQRRPTLSLARMGDILLKLQQELAETKKQLAGTQQNLTATQHKLTSLEASSLPIGFIYVQLPRDRSPKELWPSLVWTDVSSEYPGVFFRVEGGGAAPFGQIQPENAPVIEQVQTGSVIVGHTSEELDTPITLPKTGWSNGFHVGFANAEKHGKAELFLNLKRPEVSEVRPKNMAVRVWRRTA